MKRFRQFLNEALINVTEDDINFIYKQISPRIELLEKIVKKVGTNPDKNMKVYEEMREAMRLIGAKLDIYQHNYAIITSFTSSVLKSPQCKKAHQIKPCKIYIVTSCDSPFYDSAGSQIIVGPFVSELKQLMNKRLYEEPTGKAYLMLALANISKNSLKQVIRHELTHWLDDALHNSHIENKAIRYSDSSKYADEIKTLALKKNILWNGESHPYMSNVEINAMVHHIAQLRRNLGPKKYDAITWQQLTAISPGLFSLNKHLGAPWRKLMFNRLSREGLIGKNFMKNLG